MMPRSTNMKSYLALLLLAALLPNDVSTKEVESMGHGNTNTNNLRRTTSELQDLEQMEAQQLKELRKRMEPRTLLLESPSMSMNTSSSAPVVETEMKKKHLWFWQKDESPPDPVPTSPSSSTPAGDVAVAAEDSKPPSHQFFHLHHMKTGGTSVSNWINCGIKRFQQMHQVKFNRYSLSECSYTSYQKCISNDDASCRSRIDNANVMNYCAPLSVSDALLDWKDADAITMLRHPVDRVWSMFRFQTKRCFQCHNLTQVYQDIDEGNLDGYGSGVCLDQLSNHQMRNLQSKLSPTGELLDSMTEEERIQDAIDNIQNRFVVVGIMERLEESIELFSYSFPWLAETLEGPQAEGAGTCPFPHKNSSPSNNHCGNTGKHWELPAHPDPETRRAIEEHNQLDIKVYEAALEHFQLQVEAYSLQGDIE